MSPYLASTMNRQRGITLVETMVALTLITLIATVTFGVLRTGQQSWQMADRVSQERMRIQGANTALRRMIQQIQAIYEPTPQGRVRLAFKGDVQQLDFTGPIGMMAGGRSYRASLSLREGQLWLDTLPPMQRPVRDSGIAQSWSVLDRMEGLKLSYWGQGDNEIRARWHKRWTDALVLPERVRFQLTRAGEKIDWQFLLLTTSGQPLGG